jgi:hypothetical protein
MDMNKYLVYLHRDRCTNEIFYVGIGDRSRAYDEKNRSQKWKQRISDCYFDVEILAKNLPKNLAFKIEQNIVDLYGIDNLVNQTKGGAGTLGYRHTKESKLKIAFGQIGIKKSQEQIRKVVESRVKLYSNKYRHIETGQIFQGLKNACDHFNIDYKKEHQRIKRNSLNKNFELI